MDGRTIVIEVTEEEAERGLFYMPWVDLREWLRDESASFNKHPWITRLEPAPTLTYRCLDSTELRLIYRCQAGAFTSSYFHEVYGFAYRIDGDPFTHEQYVAASDGDVHFETRDHKPLSVEEVGRRILSVLIGASKTAPMRIC